MLSHGSLSMLLYHFFFKSKRYTKHPTHADRDFKSSDLFWLHDESSIPDFFLTHTKYDEQTTLICHIYLKWAGSILLQLFLAPSLHPQN